MKRLSDRSAQWVYYLVACFYMGTVFLRSILIYRDSSDLLPILGWMFAWIVLFFSEPIISRRWSPYFPIYLALQTGLVLVLLDAPGHGDFFASLFAILSMQIMLHLNLKVWVAWLGFCALVTMLLLMKVYENQVYALVLIYTAGNVFYGFYAQATRRAQSMRADNLALVQDIQEANQKLQSYAVQVEQLVVARERNRLARDLHDSVTQTVFSMTLTTQSASLLMQRDPSKVEAQLNRLSQLARNALSEMQLLIAELKPETNREGLAVAVADYLKGGRFPENLPVVLHVEGSQSLEPGEEEGLFRIVQEALNNIMKHAQASSAQVRLHLTDPLWIEVEDQGRGFDMQKGQNSGRVGLFSMRERAEEIGWDLQIRTSPGAGTCVRVEKLPNETRQS